MLPFPPFSESSLGLNICANVSLSSGHNINCLYAKMNKQLTAHFSKSMFTDDYY
jgi:hypothetical protein